MSEYDEEMEYVVFHKDELSDKEIECYELFQTYGACQEFCKYYHECHDKLKGWKL